MKTEPLDRRILQLRRRLRQVVWLSGLSRLIALLFGAALVVGFVDWAVHLNDAGLRLLLGLTILALAGWVAWRHLIVPLRQSPSDVDLALRIERRFPGFRDSLASTVQFLERGVDPALGSPALQQSVIQRAAARAERINLTDVIETRGVRRLVAVAVAVCLIAALLVGLNQSHAGIALSRLVFPFADVAWPRTTDLRLLDEEFQPLPYGAAAPLRLARGDVLTIYVENVRGRLPDDVQMEYRFSEDEIEREPLRTVTRKDANGRPRELGVATLTAVRGPVWFRAVGGDDRDKPSIELEVVPPPLLEELQVTLTPPGYSGRPRERLAKGVGHLAGLVGTKVEVAARANKRLKTAELRVRGMEAQPVVLDSKEGRRMTARFVISEPGVYSYWFDLKDSQGFENPEAPRYEVRAIADLPPEIQIEKPPVDQYVTADADVPLSIRARDDLGLNNIRLHYKLGSTENDSGEPRVLRDGEHESERPNELDIDWTWPLSEMSLSPGMRIVFYATATDHYDLGEVHVGRSISRTLTIVTAEEKQAELASRQAGLLEELERLFEAQSLARQQVGELQTQLSKVGSLRAEDVDLLKRIELDQRQISARLLNPVDGFAARTAESLADLEQNKLDAPEMADRLGELLEEIESLRQESLPAIEQQLTRARKSANASPGRRAGRKPEGGDKPEPKPEEEADRGDGDERTAPPESPRDGGDETAALERAREHQDAALESLDVMRQRLAQWRDRHDLLQEFDKLLEGQEQVQQDAAEVGRRTLRRRGLEQLTPQEEADLAKVAERQRSQADRLDEFHESLSRLQAEAEQGKRSRTAGLDDAAQHIEDAAIGSNMRLAADALRQNRIGIAAAGQQRAMVDLKELRDRLTQEGAPDSERLVKRLKQAEQELQELRKRQEELRKRTESADQLTDAAQRELELKQLRKDQQSLREEVARMSRKLRRLRAQRPSDSAGRAGERLEQAEKELSGDRPADAARQQQEALDDLEQAQRELAQSRWQAEEQLARELMEQMAGKLASMVEQQQAAIDETQRLEAARRKRGRFSRGQLSSLRQLRERQEQLQGDTRELVEMMSAVEVFALALEGAAQKMNVAVERLGKRLTDDVTVAAEEAARQRFAELIAALKPDDGGSQAQQTPGGEGGAQQPVPADVVSQLAQLKMLKTMQEGLIRRTAEIDAEARPGGELSDAHRQQLDQIAGLQGRLADLARNLMQRAAESIEIDEPPERGADETPEER